jgi:arginase
VSDALPPLGRPCLLGLPYDASSSYLRGAAGAPEAIREALYSPAGNGWSEDLQDLGSASGNLADAGDLALANRPGDRSASRAARLAIEHGVTGVIARGERPISLGGDHSVTYPILRAIAAAHGPVTVVHVDAHSDLYDEFDGDPCSHACPFARALEDGCIHRLIQIGIRTLNPHQRDQAKRFGVEIFDMRGWVAGQRPSFTVAVSPLYVSIDLDGLDPAYAPGVSHPEPGGLSVREVLGLVQNLPVAPVGADVVELNPTRDPLGLTAGVAAKLVRELASRMLRP